MRLNYRLQQRLAGRWCRIDRARWRRVVCPCLLLGLLGSVPWSAFAAQEDPWWITPGALSYHFKNRDQFNQRHPALGVEYQLAPDWALVGGTFRNSNFRWAQYLGSNWTPIALGDFRLGATAQVTNHYKFARDGKPFAFAAPMLGYTAGRFGANLYVIPSIRAVTGALGLQFKFNL